MEQNKKGDSYHYDVTIVGAGPAGAVLSYLLARSGINTLLIERDSDFEREFRGPAYQPVLLEYFNQMGILDKILDLPHFSLSEFTVKEDGENLFNFKIQTPEGRKAYALALPQGPLLKTLIELASEFPNFTFLGNGDAEELITSENGAIAGVTVRQGDRELSIHSRLTIGADGRYSKLRDLAKIEKAALHENFDVVWFDLPKVPELAYELGLDINHGGILVAIPEKKDMLRIGWVLKKGMYDSLQRQGLDHFKEQIVQTKPPLQSVIDHITSWKQLFLLDVQIAVTKSPQKEGLLLIGDAAHTASPVGAQGNKLAIQDAVALHPILVNALKTDEKILHPTHFTTFIKRRLKETKKIFRRQHLLSKVLFNFDHPFLKKLRRTLLPKIANLFMKKMSSAIAWGYEKIEVDTSKFSEDSPQNLLHHYAHLKVNKVIRETKDTHSFTFSIPRHLRKLFQFQAGQFITLRLLDRGELHRRCYSLSCSPNEKNTLRVTVKRVKGGLISNDLIDLIHEGDSLLVLPPAGQFNADLGVKSHILIAAGSGIGPLMSILYSCLENQKDSNVTLLFSNHSKDDIIFHRELEKLKSQYRDRLSIEYHISKEKGRLTEESFTSFLRPFVKKGTFYLCGPEGLMESAESALLKLETHPGQIRRERYHSIIEPFEESDLPAKKTTVGSGEEITGQAPQTLQATLRGRKVSLKIQPNETILDALIRVGEEPPYSCKEGICSTCIAELQSGKIVMDKHSALSQTDIDQNKILTCQARCLTKHTEVTYD